MIEKAMKAIVVNPNVYSSRFVSFRDWSGGGGSAIVAPSSGCDRVSVDSMLNTEARRGARWIARRAGGDSLRRTGAFVCAAQLSAADALA